MEMQDGTDLAPDEEHVAQRIEGKTKSSTKQHQRATAQESNAQATDIECSLALCCVKSTMARRVLFFFGPARQLPGHLLSLPSVSEGAVERPRSN